MARAEAPDPLTIPPTIGCAKSLKFSFPIAHASDKWDVRAPRWDRDLPIPSGLLTAIGTSSEYSVLNQLALSSRSLRFGVKLLDVSLRQTTITLRRNTRLFSPHTCPRAFARRDRADAGGAPALPGDGIPPRPSREFLISRSERARFLGPLERTNLSGAHLDGTNFFKAVLDRADLSGAFLNGAQFLNCAQLIVAQNWQSAFRDDALACGAAIPNRKPSE